MISRLTMFESLAMKLLLGVDIDLGSFNPTLSKNSWKDWNQLLPDTPHSSSLFEFSSLKNVERCIAISVSETELHIIIT